MAEKVFFGTVLDSDNYSYKALMEKGFIERNERYDSLTCNAITQDSDFIYICYSDFYIKKIRKSDFEVVGEYNSPSNILTSDMKGIIESDLNYLYAMKRVDSTYSIIIKIDKSTMNLVAESSNISNANGYALDDANIYVITQSSTDGGMITLSKSTLAKSGGNTNAYGLSIAVNDTHYYIDYGATTQIQAFDKSTHSRTLINFDAVGGTHVRVIVHNNNPYLLTTANLVLFNNVYPFAIAAKVAISGVSLYFASDAIYGISTSDVRKINADTLINEEMKPRDPSDKVDYLVKNESESLFYYFYTTDKRSLMSLREGYKSVGYERVL